MASIVLLIDACTQGPVFEHRLTSGSPIGNALRKLREARNQAPAAKNLLDSLMEILRRHEEVGVARARPEGGVHDEGKRSRNTAAVLRTLLATATTIQHSNEPVLFPRSETPVRSRTTEMDDGSGGPISNLDSMEQVPAGIERSEQLDGLPECLDLWGSEFGGMQWGDLFSELDSSLL